MGGIDAFFENFFYKLDSLFNGYAGSGPGGINPGVLLVVALIALGLMLYFFIQSQK